MTRIINSTVSGDVASGYASGLRGSGTVTLTSTTVSGNFANLESAVIHNIGTMNLFNTMVANSELSSDCTAGVVTVNAQYSLIESGLGCVNGTNTNNLTGNPLFGPLAHNGGATRTHAPLLGSPVIDKGRGFGLTADQRGLRPPVDLYSTSNASCRNGADIGV